jgi:hypothetical protein
MPAKIKKKKKTDRGEQGPGADTWTERLLSAIAPSEKRLDPRGGFETTSNHFLQRLSLTDQNLQNAELRQHVFVIDIVFPAVIGNSFTASFQQFRQKIFQ